MQPVHSGHRQRVRDKFRRFGLDSFAPHEVLEFLLFYAIRRKDTNPLAHALLAHFGSLSAVLNAPTEELIRFPDITPRAAAFLHLVRDLGCEQDCPLQEDVLQNQAQVGRFFCETFGRHEQEEVWLLLLNNRFEKLYCERVYEGPFTSPGLQTKRLLEIALRHRAPIAILAHNHPHGPVVPSAEDLALTRSMRGAFDLVGVALLDHFLVLGDRYVTLAARAGSVYQQPNLQTFYRVAEEVHS